MRYEIMTDSDIAVHWLLGAGEELEPEGVPQAGRKIRQTCQKWLKFHELGWQPRGWTTRPIRWICREANKAADRLTEIAIEREWKSAVYWLQPEARPKRNGSMHAMTDAGFRESDRVASWAVVIWQWDGAGRCWRLLTAQAGTKEIPKEEIRGKRGGIVNLFELGAAAKAADIMYRIADPSNAPLQEPNSNLTIADVESLELLAAPWHQTINTVKNWQDFG